MRDKRLGRTLAIGIAALAVFNTVSNLSMPVADRRPSLGMTMAVAVALLAHSVVYWFGDRVRQRFTVAGYIGVQAALVFLVGLTATIVPVVLTLYVALTVESIIVAESHKSIGSRTYPSASATFTSWNRAVAARTVARSGSAGADLPGWEMVSASAIALALSLGIMAGSLF